MVAMMTRRDVLNQMKRVGIKDLSLLKKSCREFENYMAVNYDYKIHKKKRPIRLSAPSFDKPASSPMKISENLRRRTIRYYRQGSSASTG